MEWLPFILMGAIYAIIGAFVERWPETLAGYNTMSPERKAQVDIRRCGKFLSRLLYALSALSLAGLATLPFDWSETAAVICLLLPIPALIAGSAYASLKYDAKRRKKHQS